MPVNHVFVLMMENRSFDHLLGYSGLPGIDAPPAGATVQKNKAGERVEIMPNAEDGMGDLDHEYPSVRVQLRGADKSDADPVTMDGFYLANGVEALRCFAEDAPEVRVLRQLAREYCVIDPWFASLPGPTWPNRFFLHAATSGGLDNSPSNLESMGAVTLESLGFDFQYGTIYDWLDKAGLEWRVYHDDLLPQVLSIKGMPQRFVDPKDKHFRWLGQLDDDLQGGYTPSYTFIEPSYDVVNGYRGGNSQHAAGTVSSGDALINWVYQKIRASSLWESSALLILYDEHGGFYDHVKPPKCTPPGDDRRNQNKAEARQNSAFDQLGVRVPAVLVSPWVLKGTVGKAQDGRPYDHSSVIRSLTELFPTLKGALQQAGKTSLTGRDGSAASFLPLLSLAKPRNDDLATLQALQALPAAISQADQIVDNVEELVNGAAAGGLLTGFTHLASAVELARQQLAGEPTLHPTLGAGDVATKGGVLGFIRQLAELHPKLGGSPQ
jgi:phospholipase C